MIDIIQIKYKELFNIELLHGFYLSGKCSDVELVPTNACQQTLKYYGLRFLPSDFGGKLFAKVNTVGNKDFVKNPLADGTKFSFLLRVKRNVFENFTQLSLTRPLGSHYYFNNLVNNISAAGMPLLVANTGTKVVADNDLLSFVSGSFAFAHNNAAPVQNSELRFTDSGEIFQQSLNNSNNVFNFTYDLNKTSGGRAKLFIENIEKASMYVMDTADSADVFGIVEIFYKKTLPPAYQFQKNDNSVETKLYKIAFANRATKWRYVITKKFNQAVTAVTVGKTNGTPIVFAAQAGSPPDQFIMASANPLPLKEEPVTGIKLSDQTAKVIIANLPNPPLTMVRKEGPDIFQTYSLLFKTI